MRCKTLVAFSSTLNITKNQTRHLKRQSKQLHELLTERLLGRKDELCDRCSINFLPCTTANHLFSCGWCDRVGAPCTWSSKAIATGTIPGGGYITDEDHVNDQDDLVLAMLDRSKGRGTTRGKSRTANIEKESVTAQASATEAWVDAGGEDGISDASPESGEDTDDDFDSSSDIWYRCDGYSTDDMCPSDSDDDGFSSSSSKDAEYDSDVDQEEDDAESLAIEESDPIQDDDLSTEGQPAAHLSPHPTPELGESGHASDGIADRQARAANNVPIHGEVVLPSAATDAALLEEEVPKSIRAPGETANHSRGIDMQQEFSFDSVAEDYQPHFAFPSARFTSTAHDSVADAFTTPFTTLETPRDPVPYYELYLDAKHTPYAWDYASLYANQPTSPVAQRGGLDTIAGYAGGPYLPVNSIDTGNTDGGLLHAVPYSLAATSLVGLNGVTPQTNPYLSDADSQQIAFGLYNSLSRGVPIDTNPSDWFLPGIPLERNSADVAEPVSWGEVPEGLTDSFYIPPTSYLGFNMSY